ncbi:MAG: hypothetical protein ACI8S6_001075 [Myxococcota bacterium]
MRLVAENLDAITAAGADVVVLTSDTPETLDGLDLPALLPFVSGSPALWAELSLSNPDKPELPHPATLIIAPSGEILLREVHVNYRERTPIPDMLAALSSTLPPSLAAAAPAAVDWSSGAVLSLSGADDCLSLDISVAEGFHLYGAKEAVSRPLQVTVDQAPSWVLLIPDGEEVTLEGLGTSWVLTGQHMLQWALPEGLPRQLSGTILHQLCTETACSAPRTEPWSLVRAEGPCLAPEQQAP